MKRTKEIFQRQRELEEFEPFNHQENFCKKVKQNWLSNEEFATLESKSLIELTQVLIDKEMDTEYLDKVMELIEEKEEEEKLSYISGEKGEKYLKLVLKTPLANMQRVLDKYDNIDFYMTRSFREHLEIRIIDTKDRLRQINKLF
jgi:hypothetical protein